METYHFKNAIVNVYGEVDREKLEKATIKFMKKADKCRKNKLKERKQNDNKNTSRAI